MSVLGDKGSTDCRLYRIADWGRAALPMLVGRKSRIAWLAFRKEQRGSVLAGREGRLQTVRAGL